MFGLRGGRIAEAVLNAGEGKDGDRGRRGALVAFGDELEATPRQTAARCRRMTGCHSESSILFRHRLVLFIGSVYHYNLDDTL